MVPSIFLHPLTGSVTTVNPQKANIPQNISYLRLKHFPASKLLRDTDNYSLSIGKRFVCSRTATFHQAKGMQSGSCPNWRQKLLEATEIFQDVQPQGQCSHWIKITKRSGWRVIFFYGTLIWDLARRVSDQQASQFNFLAPIRRYLSGCSPSLFRTRDGKQPRVTSRIEAQWPPGDVPPAHLRILDFPPGGERGDAHRAFPVLRFPRQRNRKTGDTPRRFSIPRMRARHRFRGPSMHLQEYSIVHDSLSRRTNTLVPLTNFIVHSCCGALQRYKNLYRTWFFASM